MKTQVIAEIGINHNGDMDITKKLIDISVIAGCDVVKFQKRNPDVCVPEHQKSVMRKTPWGEMTYLEYKHKIEFGKDEYDEIDEYCKGRIQWTASPWDLDSVEFLEQYDLQFVKIHSALLTDYNLINPCGSTDAIWSVPHIDLSNVMCLSITDAPKQIDAIVVVNPYS